MLLYAAMNCEHTWYTFPGIQYTFYTIQDVKQVCGPNTVGTPIRDTMHIWHCMHAEQP